MLSNRVLFVSAVLALAACGNDAPPPPPVVAPVVAPVIPGQPVAPGQPVPGMPVVPGQPVIPGQPMIPGQPAIPGAPGGLASNFGTITIMPGFQPDPTIAQGTSGGAVQASSLNGACAGWVSQQADHILMVGGPLPLVRVMVNGGASDTTLVIQRPDGQYICNDDTEGTNPVVAASLNPGPHKIWVGSYQQGQNAPYNLGISANASAMPAMLGAPAGGAAPGTPTGGGLAIAPGDYSSTFGTITLTPGFTPDPHRANGTSGGSIQAATVAPGCTGWIASRADHVFTSAGMFTTLRIMVKSTADTTLVVQRPDNTFVCNDDTQDRNPVVGGSFPPGNYRIWVGSYTQNQQSAYTLGFTELSSVQPSSL